VSRLLREFTLDKGKKRNKIYINFAKKASFFTPNGVMKKHPCKENLDLSSCQVFFDFDNTITPFDVFDDIVARFSTDKRWQALEKAWREGRIGSKECLEGQLRSVRITRPELARYLSGIKVDPSFSKLLAMFKAQGIRPVILSDNFAFIIEGILRHNGVREVKIYANKSRFYRDRIKLSFPYRDKRCFLCAHCKRNNLLKQKDDGKIVIYIGDGLSDICPAKLADLVFAKGSLLKQFRKTKRECIPIRNLGDVYRYLRQVSR
jgi:2,3-diketo-5-methylthio-1-phosphopentane phosphatase